ncbi:MAG: TonB-dependent receptor [Agarilytica sp.]
MRYLLLVILITSPFGLTAPPVYSDTANTNTNIELNLPAQTLHQALIELASQTGLEILFGKGVVTRRNSQALTGWFTIENALNTLLKGSGLRYTLGNRQIRIINAKEKSHTLPKITVTGYLRDDQDFISYGDDSQEQFPLYQLPLSIQSISEKQIDDVQARNIDDALSYINGIEYFDFSGGINPQYYSRGIITPFSIDGKFYRRTLSAFDPGLLERIDLIQGPSANYMNPGGMLNFVTKKPKRGNRYDVSFTGASEDFFRTELDVNISSNGEKKNALRLIGIAEKSNHVKDFAGHKRYALSSGFAHEFQNGTQLLLSGIYQSEERYPNTFTYHDSLLGASLPRNATLGYPWAESIKNEVFFSSEITNISLYDWIVSGGANYNNSELDSTMAVIGAPEDILGNAFVGYMHTPDITSKTYGLDVAAEKSFSFFSIESLLRIGLDYQHFDQGHPNHAPTLLLALDGNPFAPFQFFNINNPNYNYPKPPPSPKTGSFKQLTDFYGLLISQSYYLTDYLTLYADVRYEDMQFEAELVDLLAPANWTLIGRYQEYTPKVGINLTLSDSLSSHLSYTEAFTYQGAADADRISFTGSSTSDIVPPIKNIQYEYALKKRWFEGRIQNNLTLYKIQRSDIQAFVPPTLIEPAHNRPAPNQQSKGVNFELSGQATENIKLLTNISYNEGNIVDELTLLFSPDNRAYASAKTIANAWFKYSFTSGFLNNTDISFGIKYVGERYGDNANTFTLPAYTTSNAFISYSGVDNLTFKLAIRNIFDKYYYKSSLGTNYLVEEGPPRNISFTIQSAQNF